MVKQLFSSSSRPAGWLLVFLINLTLVLRPDAVWAHPMPNSVVLLTIHVNRIDAEIQIPLVELQSAWGHAVNDSSVGLIARLGPQLRDYLKGHIRPQRSRRAGLDVSIGELTVQEPRTRLMAFTAN